MQMTIDWLRRYRLMRLHFAAELVLEIVTQKYHLEKVGAHIAENKARIDFVFPEHISSLFDVILDDYNKIITQTAPSKLALPMLLRKDVFGRLMASRRFPVEELMLSPPKRWAVLP